MNRAVSSSYKLKIIVGILLENILKLIVCSHFYDSPCFVGFEGLFPNHTGVMLE